MQQHRLRRPDTGHREGMLHGFEHHDVIDIRFRVFHDVIDIRFHVFQYVNGYVVYVGFSEFDKPNRQCSLRRPQWERLKSRHITKSI